MQLPVPVIVPVITVKVIKTNFRLGSKPNEAEQKCGVRMLNVDCVTWLFNALKNIFINMSKRAILLLPPAQGLETLKFYLP